MDNKRTRVGGGRLVRVAGALALAFASLVGGTHAAAAFTTCAGPTCFVAPADDNYTTPFDAPLTVPAPGVLANDSGPVGTAVQVADSDTQSWNGATVSVKANGSFTYTPDPANPYSGIDQFDYAIHHGPDDEDFATVYITVVPHLGNDTGYTQVNQVLNVAAPGVFGNDQGIDTTMSPDYSATSVHGGAVAVNDDGSYQYVPPSNFSGVDTFTYSQWDIDLDNEYTATVSVYVDSTPPTISVPVLPAVNLQTRFHVGWSGADALSGVAGYDVNQSAAPWNGNYGAATSIARATTATGSDRFGTYGETYCYSARAHDRAANVSAWSGRRCTSVPIKATQLTFSSGWATQNSAAYFGAVARTTATYGARATRASIRAKQIWIVVTKCPTCGVVTIRWNGVVKANLNLSSPTTRHQQVVSVLAFSAAQNGTLTATLASHGKSAIIEGLAVNRG